jgi:omega-amidase
MRAACYPFDVVTGDVTANLASARQGLRQALEQGVELLVLPEMWPAGFPKEPSAELLGASNRALQDLATDAASARIAIVGSAHGGDIPRPSNRAHRLQAGRVNDLYDKVHLFSPTAEAASFTAGTSAPPVFEWRGFQIAVVICYDLRFPELVRAAFRAGAEVICVVAQWPEPRDPHWNALVIGRAVETQAYVVACNRVGTSVVGRREMSLVFPGLARIVTPGGETLAVGEDRAELVIAELDPDVVRSLRRGVPVARDERQDLYREWAGGAARPI